MPININTDLLIAAPMLQDAFVDKDGTPMAGGTVTCYHDNSRTTLKNWYYQSGSPGAYTYIPLPNPLTLSAAGTIADVNGVDTIPFFYPYSEINDTVADPYYITIVNFAQTNQITRQNFPFVPPNNNNPNFVNSVNNLIINNGFWRNILPNTTATSNSTNVSNQTFLTVAPSQHDGFRMPDITFIKAITGDTDSLSFLTFPLSSMQPIKNYIVPEYYINHLCTAPTGGQTQKCYQFPISLHINTLESVPFTVSIQAQNIGSTGTGQNVINLFILQDCGTGVSSPNPMQIGSITLNSSWQTYTFTFAFPPTAGLTLSSGADDALYLQVQMPLTAACSINFTKPSIFLTTDIIPNNDFQTYDQVDSIINSPRTGDIRTSINQFYFYGWVPLDNGAIGLSNPTTIGGYSRANTDTWQLYSLLWNYAKPYDTGATFNAICQMYLNNGSTLTAINYGASAYADFIANHALSLTPALGFAIMGAVPLPGVTAGLQTQFVTFSNSAGNVLVTGTNGSFFYVGQPISFAPSSGTLPIGINTNAIYYLTNLSGNTFNIAATYLQALAGTPVAPFANTGTPTNLVITTLAGTVTGQYSHTQLASELAAHTHVATTNTTFSAGNTNGAPFANVIVGQNASIPITLPGTTTISANTPAGSPFNVTQPSVFYNMYMKL
jgi:hypothetical protein